jgi:hypothetical protein
VPDEFSIPERRPFARLFSALRLAGAVRQAFDLRKLLIAALGLVIFQAGALLLNQIAPVGAVDAFEADDVVRKANGARDGELWSPSTVTQMNLRLSEPVRLLAGPLFAFVDPGNGWLRMLHAFASLLWLFVVWGICGGAITRIAIGRAAGMRQTSSPEALRFAWANVGPLIIAPLCPLLGVAVIALICIPFGFLYRIPSVGPALAGIGLVFPLVAGLVMALLVAGLAAGWPLLQAATAGGAEDALDAMSRIFSYLNQRLGSFVALVALAWLLGAFGLALIDLLTSGVIHMARWTLALSAPPKAIEPFFDASAPSPASVAGTAHAFWLGSVRLIGRAWVFSFFWTAAAYIYLWLRHEVDGVPWTEIEPPIAPVSPTGS